MAEHSIINAYLENIKNAKHFIYIENQFFVSGNNTKIVKNKIASALIDRIIRAHKEKTPFKVIVFMPLFPSFPDIIPGKEGGALKKVLYF